MVDDAAPDRDSSVPAPESAFPSGKGVPPNAAGLWPSVCDALSRFCRASLLSGLVVLMYQTLSKSLREFRLGASVAGVSVTTGPTAVLSGGS